MTVNNTNILRAVISYQSSLLSFYVLTIWFVIFSQKDFGAKAAHKMLVKLTPGDIICILLRQTSLLSTLLFQLIKTVRMTNGDLRNEMKC
jgi:hypothetical protein